MSETDDSIRAVGLVPITQALPRRVSTSVAAAGADAEVERSSPRQKRDVRWETEPDEEAGFPPHLVHLGREIYKPGSGLFKRTEYLDEWKKATVGRLDGDLLDLKEAAAPTPDLNKAWWESPAPKRRRGSVSAKPQKAEAFDGEYDDRHGR